MNSNDHRPKLAASYARSAVENPLSIAQQHARNAACAERDGYRILPEHCFADHGESGLAASGPALDRLVALVTRGDAPFDRLYLRDRCRLSRSPDPRDHFAWEILFEHLGVEICYSDCAPTDSLGGAR